MPITDSQAGSGPVTTPRIEPLRPKDLGEDAVVAATPALTIAVTAGVGTAPTALAAFDAALRAVGAANFNLVRLSSVIPPASVVIPATGPVPTPGDWGDRLYCVYAHESATHPDEEAWAGVGWVQSPETGAGLFVEHEARSEPDLRALIIASLESISSARDVDFGPPEMVLSGARCEDQPTAAMVMAAFRAEGWETSKASRS